MAEYDGRRRRAAISCSLCRRRKIRCNRETPCSNCRRSRSGACIYENPNHPPPSPSRNQADEPGPAVPSSRESITIDSSSHSSSSHVAASTDPSTPVSQLSAQDAESLKLKLRIRQLEDQLAKSTLRTAQSPVSNPSNSSIEKTSSHLGGTFHVLCETGSTGQPQSIARSITHKTRLFGQSHWGVNGVLLIRDIWETIEPHLLEGRSNAWTGIERCKSLARIIKARRTPPWPSPPTSDLPSRMIADALVDCYLRTTESIYRVLHIPTFRRDYQTLWLSQDSPRPNTPFLVQLKLVLAIGAVTYNKQFSSRASAVQWVHEAITWISEPKFKSRLDIPILQTSLLLLIAQERVGAGGDSTWISIGTVFRKAVFLGLHRDPARLPKGTIFVAEMRRRLWNTILEMTLQSSLSSGGPPFFSLDDFDTAPPGNFDDDQLVATNDPVPRPGNVFTQVSISIALQKTFSQRLAVVKFLNDLSSSGTYEETLQLDAKLRTAYRELGRTLQAFSKSGTGASPTGSSPSPFEIRAVDFEMHRYLSSLHVPYFGPALHETAYAFSRKVVVDSSLKIWRAAYPSSGLTSITEATSSDWDDLAQLTVCGSGFYSTVTIHAALLISVELRTQLQEEESLVPVPLRPDLLTVIDEAKAWCLRGIEVGETNVKGYLLMSVVGAGVEGLQRGLDKDAITQLLIRAAESVEEKCLPILKQIAATQGEGEVAEEDMLPQESVATPGADMMEDWGFMNPDGMFDLGNTEPVNWIFNDDTDQRMPTYW